MANLLKFEEDKNQNMVVSSVPGKSNRFVTDFEVVSKIGEGSFGEAFKVRSRTDG